MGWKPVLDGALAEDAWRAIRELAGELETVALPRRAREDVTLFWAYAAGAFDDAVSAARYEAATDALIARIERGIDSIGLFGGFSGIWWVLAHVSAGGAADRPLAMIDATLDEVVGTDVWTAQYDLIAGLTGIAVYLLERLEQLERRGGDGGDGGEQVARRALGRVVDHLAARVETGRAGSTWFTEATLLPDWQRAQCSGGYYNCGVAHGVPGTIAALARIAALPDAPPRAGELAGDALRWLRAQQLDEVAVGSRYPAWFARDQPSSTRLRARTAWCYGDPGVAAAAWGAAARLGDPGGSGGLIEPWQSLAAGAAALPVEACKIFDAGLCHGAFGLAHLYNRCYQASNVEAFRAAAVTWYRRGLALRRPGEGIAGFCNYVGPSGDRPASWNASDEFLDGASGIGLALLAAVTAEEPCWDRRLLCDIPMLG